MVVEKKYFIYKYEWDDGSIYIGQSTTNRRGTGEISRYKNSPKVYNKMKKHPEFSIEILEEVSSIDELNEKERFYVKLYNSFYKNNQKGLNLTMGGDGVLGHEPWNKGIVGKIKQSDECKRKHSEVATNLHKDHPEYFSGRFGDKNPLSKKVNQYDLDGNLIKIWDSIGLAAKELSLQDSKISAVCKYKRNKTGGFIWRYA